jgi:hypothetical protein
MLRGSKRGVGKKKDSRPSTKGVKLARGQQQVSSRRPTGKRRQGGSQQDVRFAGVAQPECRLKDNGDDIMSSKWWTGSDWMTACVCECG